MPLQALPLVSTIWGVVLFGEYFRSSKRTYLLLVSSDISRLVFSLSQASYIYQGLQYAHISLGQPASRDGLLSCRLACWSCLPRLWDFSWAQLGLASNDALKMPTRWG